MLERLRTWLLRIGAVVLPAACVPVTTTGATRAPAAEPRPAREIRVVTFNTWLVPFRDRAGLAQRIARSIGELDADVVALQEVWRDRDGRALAAALNDAGYPWVEWRAASGVFSQGSPGLLIASRHPLENAAFTPFHAGRLPLVAWQPDWFSNKGFLAVDVHGPSGAFRFVTTHAQADYRSNRYNLVRLSHMLQLGRAVSGTTLPLVLAGDLNVRRGEIGHAALLHAARLGELERSYGVDGVYFRGGESRGVREIRSERVLERDTRGRLSDHHGVLAVLELVSEPGAPDVGSSDAIVSAIVDHERRIWQRAAAAALVAIAAGGVWLSLRHGPPNRWRTTARLLVGVIGLWCVYYAAVYAPAEARWLSRAKRDLVAARRLTSA